MAAPSVPLTTIQTTTTDRRFASHPTISLIDQCSTPHQIKQIHAQMLRAGLFSDPFSASKLLHSSAFSESPSLRYARQVFDQIPQPNLYSWNVLLRAYASSSQPIDCLLVFIRLLQECVERPNKFTYPFVINASAQLADSGLGRVIHGMAVKEGFSSDLFVNNSLIHFYCECGLLDAARRVFAGMPERDAVSWNSMINGLAQNSFANEATEFFLRMDWEIGVKPNDVTLVGLLSACGKKADLKFGKWVHSYITKNGIEPNLILCNAILDMYAKCVSMKDARNLFDRMNTMDIISWTTVLAGYAKSGDFNSAMDLFESLPKKDIAAWNALISGYEQNGNPMGAIAIFNELQLSKATRPNEVTLVSILSACSQLGALDLGIWAHIYIKRENVRLNCHLATALIDMYSKCGDLKKALEVFNSVDKIKRDTFVWSSMIAGLGMHGRGKDAIEVFSKMQEAKVKPTSITLMNLLSACSHSGLAEEGREFFNQMESFYGVKPSVEHYACMVDILGRAGLLDEAVELIGNMSVNPSASVWGSLLGACRLHKNVDLAENACERLLAIEPQNHGACVLLSNIYADLGKWDKVSELRKRMRDAGLKKEPGCSLVEIGGAVHEFLVGDITHPISREIYSKLGEIADRLKSSGYVPRKSEVLQLVEEEDMREKALHLHSERLALAFGLLSDRSGRPIRIVKNLRVCGDCHEVMKLVSEVYDREIVLRDRYRFHHFKGGYCSCKDYW
ncbi:Pentatricopeptide repeat-containing protein -chloroplastic [Striga hermonthica]|uniref:Pentatricopeptide repeat-containing protein -chloroplastic n=1 Tax=Striga hermonthica TaxID=68872 RepID=A0A9N7ML00_STRHE|nr:Pentatricopeptide repeat-containing protein -chloroplastic [Striga hermonthica]